jgi:hypothetical protein
MSLGNGRGISVDEAERLHAHNAELRRLLQKHQWINVTPVKGYSTCPECGGSEAPWAHGHRPGCAIAAALAESE